MAAATRQDCPHTHLQVQQSRALSSRGHGYVHVVVGHTAAAAPQRKRRTGEYAVTPKLPSEQPEQLAVDPFRMRRHSLVLSLLAGPGWFARGSAAPDSRPPRSSAARPPAHDADRSSCWPHPRDPRHDQVATINTIRNAVCRSSIVLILREEAVELNCSFRSLSSLL